MKILFCTNVFEVVENGPVKFANLLLQINERYPEHELHILTEDIAESRSFVHKVPLSHFWKSSPFSQFARMWAYHQAAMRVRQHFAFDVLVYNNALVGLWSSYRFGSTVGMINDDNNLSASWQQSRSTSSGYKHIVFRWVEGLMARKASSILVNSEYMRKSVVKTYKVPIQKIHLLYKAVEIPAVLPASLPLDPAAPIQVLFVKSDYRRGGLFTLVEALSQLPYHFVLTIVGPNPVDREKIIAQAGHYSNLEYVFLGKVPQQNITRLLSNTQIFCVPSHKEGSGRGQYGSHGAGGTCRLHSSGRDSRSAGSRSLWMDGTSAGRSRPGAGHRSLYFSTYFEGCQSNLRVRLCTPIQRPGHV